MSSPTRRSSERNEALAKWSGGGPSYPNLQLSERQRVGDRRSGMGSKIARISLNESSVDVIVVGGDNAMSF